MSIKFFEKGDKDNPPILFFHGMMGSVSDWKKIFELLSPDFHCMAIPLPGHHLKVMHKDEYHLFLLRLIENLDNPPHLVGYSMGGRIALEFFELFHVKLGKLILESAHYGLDAGGEKELRKISDQNLFSHISTKKDFKSFLENWYSMPLFKGMAVDEIIQSKLAHFPLLPSYQEALNLFSLGNQKNYVHFINEYKKKILYLAGIEDTKYCSLSEKLENKKIIAKASHNAHMMNPIQFCEDLKVFFRE